MQAFLIHERAGSMPLTDKGLKIGAEVCVMQNGTRKFVRVTLGS
jgi:hypothetical protein